jgi:hypothetical protein
MKNTYSCEHPDCFVIHAGGECPLCEAEAEVKELKGQVAELKDKQNE